MLFNFILFNVYIDLQSLMENIVTYKKLDAVNETIKFYAIIVDIKENTVAILKGC